MWAVNVLSGFILTNFDTFLIMLLLQSYVENRTHKAVVLLGFYVGLGVLMSFAWMGLNLTQTLIDTHLNLILAIGFMGLALLSLRKPTERIDLDQKRIPSSTLRLLWMIVGIYVLSGSDNVLVYMGLLRTMRWVEQLLMLGAHVSLLSLLFLMSKYVYTHSSLQAFLSRHQGRVLSLLFFYLALVILFM